MLQPDASLSRLAGIAFLVLATSPAAPSLAAQTRGALPHQSWRYTPYTRTDGLPSNSAHRLLRDGQGTVWAATPAGLAWFDDFRWRAVGPPGCNGLPVYESLTPARQGGVFLAHERQLCHATKSGFTRRSLSWQGEPVAVRDVVQLRDGTLLVLASDFEGIQSRLLLVRPDAVVHVPEPAPLARGNPNALWRASTGSIWVNTQSALFELQQGDGGLTWLPRFRTDDDEWLRLTLLDQGPDGDVVAQIIYPLHLRGIWEWRGSGEPRRTDPDHGKIRVRAFTFHSRTSSALAVYESGEVRRRQHGSWRPARRPPACLAQAQCLLALPSGDIMVGTEEALWLFRHAATRWSYWRHASGSAANNVHEIARLRDGSLWIGTGHGVDVRDREGGLLEIRSIGGEELDDVTGIAEDGAGHVWISSGTSMQGAARWDGESWRRFTSADGLTAERVHRIRVDRRGRPWFLGICRRPWEKSQVAAAGAFVFDGDRFTRWGAAEGLRGASRVYDFVESGDGSLWFGTIDGLSRWRSGNWTHWGPAQGLDPKKVFTLALAPDGRIWFATQSPHVGYVDERDAIRYVATPPALSDGRVWQLAFDETGRLWLSVQRVGLFCRQRNGTWSAFRSGQGLAETKVWPLLATADRLYVGSTGGGTAILSLAEASAPPPACRVEAPAINVDSAVVRWTPHAYWGHLAPAHIETRYQLDGGAWSPWSTRHEAVLLGLAPGDHEFRVQAKGLFGNYSESGTRVAFGIAAPFYRRPGFLIPVALLAALVLALSTSLWRRRRAQSEERRLVENQLRESARLEAIGRLAGGVAHDFNNLLTAIRGYAELAEDDLGRPERLHHDIREIRKNVDRAASLTRQLLAFSRQQRLAPRVVDVVEIMAGLEDVLRRLLGETIELVIGSDVASACVRVDPGQLEQVILNLAINARDAMHAHGTLTITTRMAELDEKQVRQLDGTVAGPNVVLTFADTGHGMDEQTRRRVFEPFFTTKEHGKGTGLGLATVYGIVKQSGGSITCDSEPGKGTRFTLYLPVLLDVAEEPDVAAPAPPRPSASETVLLVEDETSVRAVARQVLERHGYRVIEASVGTQALQLVASHGNEIDVLVTDIVMPGMSGRQLAARLQERDVRCGVLFMSGYDRERPTGAAAEDGNFLAKPFTPGELLAGVQRVIRAEREAESA